MTYGMAHVRSTRSEARGAPQLERVALARIPPEPAREARVERERVASPRAAAVDAAETERERVGVLAVALVVGAVVAPELRLEGQEVAAAVVTAGGRRRES